MIEWMHELGCLYNEWGSGSKKATTTHNHTVTPWLWWVHTRVQSAQPQAQKEAEGTCLQVWVEFFLAGRFLMGRECEISVGHSNNLWLCSRHWWHGIVQIEKKKSNWTLELHNGRLNRYHLSREWNRTARSSILPFIYDYILKRQILHNSFKPTIVH